MESDMPEGKVNSKVGLWGCPKKGRWPKDLACLALTGKLDALKGETLEAKMILLAPP